MGPQYHGRASLFPLDTARDRHLPFRDNGRTAHIARPTGFRPKSM